MVEINTCSCLLVSYDTAREMRNSKQSSMFREVGNVAASSAGASYSGCGHTPKDVPVATDRTATGRRTPATNTVISPDPFPGPGPTQSGTNCPVSSNTTLTYLKNASIRFCSTWLLLLRLTRRACMTWINAYPRCGWTSSLQRTGVARIDILHRNLTLMRDWVSRIRDSARNISGVKFDLRAIFPLFG